MNDIKHAEKLLKDGVISEASFQRIVASQTDSLFSIGIELRSILYIGILLLSGGLGVLVYKNIDSIGHIAVVSFIALVSLACFAYSYTKRQPYSNKRVASNNTIADYVLLFGCLTFATFMGYLQYQFSVFGPHNEIAFLIPAIIFFTLAYYYDHLGVLSMAITAMAGFVGIAITPLQLLSANDFSSEKIILSGLGLGVVLLGAALYLNRKDIKSHFTFTYLNFTTHLLFVSALAGLFTFEIWLIFIPVLALFVYILARYAYKVYSFYFLLFSVIYGFIGITYLIFRLFYQIGRDSDGVIYFALMYLIGSPVLLIMYLRNANKKFKADAGI